MPLSRLQHERLPPLAAGATACKTLLSVRTVNISIKRFYERGCNRTRTLVSLGCRLYRNKDQLLSSPSVRELGGC